MEEVDLIPGLSDDLAIRCLVRLPIDIHAIFRCVCKRWNAIFSSSPGLDSYIASERICQGLAHQGSIYVMVRSDYEGYKWFVFRSDSWRAIARMPVQAMGGAVVSAQSKLFFIGGSTKRVASKSMWRYDPTSNKWLERAKMRVAREYAVAEYMHGGKIIVMGGCSPAMRAGGLAWAESYDLISNEWSIASKGRPERWMYATAVMNGKIYALTDKRGLVYDPVIDTFEGVSHVLDLGWRGKAAVLNGVLFTTSLTDKIIAYDRSRDIWRELNCNLPRMTCGPLLCAADGRLYIVGETRCYSELLVAAIDIWEDGAMLQGKIAWCKTASCGEAIAAVIEVLSVDV